MANRGVDLADYFNGEGDTGWSLPSAARRAALRTSARTKKGPRAWPPAGRLDERSWGAAGLIELVIAGIGVRLQDAGIGGQMLLGIKPGEIARSRISLPANRRH
jgi:hypothetical protein